MAATRLNRLQTIRPLWNGLVILNYHRLGDPAASPLDRKVFSGTPERFASHIATIRQWADLVDPADIPALLAADAPKGRYVALTFDDGYRDNHDLALPVLRATGARAAFFIAAGFIDRPRLPWNDEIAWMLRASTKPAISLTGWLPEPLPLAPARLDATIARVHALYPAQNEDPKRTAALLDAIAEASGSGRAPSSVSSDLWMTWEMIRALRDAGMTIGGHTLNHPSLGQVSAERQTAEITGGRDRIAAELGQAATAFAYPFGGRHQFSEETKRLLAHAGFSHAFSFYGGWNRRGHEDPFDIRRVYVSDTTSVDEITGLVTLPHLYALAPPRRRPRPTA